MSCQSASRFVARYQQRHTSLILQGQGSVRPEDAETLRLSATAARDYEKTLWLSLTAALDYEETLLLSLTAAPHYEETLWPSLTTARPDKV